MGGELTFDSGDGRGPQVIAARGVKNIAFNYGSADFAENAIANGVPGRLFLGYGISPNSGLVRMELPRLSAAGFKLNAEPATQDIAAAQASDAAFSMVRGLVSRPCRGG